MSICERTKEASKHVIVRCSGCGSIHHTKNMGSCDPTTHVVSLERSLFDTTPCQCLDSKTHPLVHVCGIDCGDDNPEEKARLKKKYDMLVMSNVMHVSANLGVDIDRETWMMIQQYENDLARKLLNDTATEEEREYFIGVDKRMKEYVDPDTLK